LLICLQKYNIKCITVSAGFLPAGSGHLNHKQASKAGDRAAEKRHD